MLDLSDQLLIEKESESVSCSVMSDPVWLHGL